MDSAPLSPAPASTPRHSDAFCESSIRIFRNIRRFAAQGCTDCAQWTGRIGAGAGKAPLVRHHQRCEEPRDRPPRPRPPQRRPAAPPGAARLEAGGRRHRHPGCLRPRSAGGRDGRQPGRRQRLCRRGVPAPPAGRGRPQPGAGAPRHPGSGRLRRGPGVRVSPEWAAWANGTAVRELDFHDTFLAADYSHPGDNIPPLLAVAQHTGRTGAEPCAGSSPRTRSMWRWCGPSACTSTASTMWPT